MAKTVERSLERISEFKGRAFDYSMAATTLFAAALRNPKLAVKNLLAGGIGSMYRRTLTEYRDSL